MTDARTTQEASPALEGPPSSTRWLRAMPPSRPPCSERSTLLALARAAAGLLRPPRKKLKVTREGKYFIGITFGVGFAAVNTGNNLLYLLLGMLLSMIVVSGVLSELSLRELTVVRRLPPRAWVARPHLVEIEAFNHKRRIPRLTRSRWRICAPDSQQTSAAFSSRSAPDPRRLPRIGARRPGAEETGTSDFASPPGSPSACSRNLVSSTPKAI